MTHPPLTLVTIPCLADNYTFLLHDAAKGATLVADVPDAAPVLAELSARDWSLSHILLTHHHYDHIDGVDALREATGAQVIGAQADAHRLPQLDVSVEDGDVFDWSGHAVRVLDVSGHTVGHVAYYIAAARAAFTGDSLMALGCGRLFEGTPDQMWTSLCALASLPDDTQICSGHEYTAANARFAVTVEPENPALLTRVQDTETARAAGRATVPSSLALEKATNPFLRAHLPLVKSALGMDGATDAAVFTEIRAQKDRF